MFKGVEPAKASLVIILISAVGYFAAGKLGLMLAIPPGYATAVWPAAGVALAAVLLHGYWACIGILIGSFFVNVSMDFDATTSAALFKSLAIPFTIGCGAALQAMVGGILLNHFVSRNLNLDSLREIAAFMVYAVIASCMVNATIGTGTLLFFDVIAPHNYLFNWATWWTGDAIGVLLFTVLVLIFFANNTEVWRPRRLTIAVPLSLCFIVVVALFVLASRWEVRQQKDEFQSKAEFIYQAVDKSIQAPQKILQTLASLSRASGMVTRDEFADFVSHALKTEKGIQALAWIPRVPDSQRADLEQKARADGLENFTITELKNGTLQSAQTKSEYYPVYFVEPEQGNEKALGLDLSSNKSRLNAMNLAIKSRSFASTESITLVQEAGNQKAVIMFMPSFSRENPDELLGLYDVVFRISDLFRSAVSDDAMSGVVLTVTETGDDNRPLELLSSTEFWPDSIAGKIVDQFQWEKYLDVGNRKWLLHVTANQDFLVASRSLVPWALLAAGLLFSGLLGVFLLYVTGETYRANKSADQLREMLEDLHATQSQLVESEKLASLGGMMSGLAHELNTPVGIAVTAISTIGERVKTLTGKVAEGKLTQTELNEFLDIAGEAAKITEGNLYRTSQLVRSFKDVAVDRATEDVRKINLAEYLEEILIYMRPSVKRTKHEITLDCAENISIVTMPGGLSQVLTNLLNNTLMHAFDEGVAGHVVIRAERVDDTVRLTYQDDGRGIPEENADKVFQPFYTTRKGSGGTGLGLHLVNNIVTERLKGSIRLLKGDAPGAHFEILLPINMSEGLPSELLR